MAHAHRSLAPRRWLRLSPRSARVRLTLLYGGMTMLLGTAILALVYLLSYHSAQVATVTTAISGRKRGSPPGSVAAFPVGALHRLVQVPAPDHTIAVDQRNSDFSHLLEILWVGLALTTLGSAVIGWFAAGRVLRPLRKITSTAQTISAGSLNQRLALAGPDDEFKRLGDTLDALLARLEASFDAQRRFVANASHELRTPLTAERTMLQVALADPDMTVDSLRATCEELLVAGVEQERLLEALLTLTSSERGVDHVEPLDLATIADTVLRSRDAQARARGLSVQTSLRPAPAGGDPALVRRLIDNLLDNAIDHNIPGGEVTIATAVVGTTAVISVANTGPPIPADQIDRLFDPFQRLDGRSARDDGHHGLGLSIVRAIATAHDARLSAHARPAGGLAVTVSFPAASASAAGPHVSAPPGVLST
ncbi:MAG TPA: HAMP domain-containing sensor histidine kinase [Solirubrobacteraceae bacterium]|nr:HAMP domain-containing sensor histidine kinase [Solirubrobacteraceae bacterium]